MRTTQLIDAFNPVTLGSMASRDEIAPDLLRLSIYVPDFGMPFNHFLVRDEEPLLFHAGFKGMFPALRAAVATLRDPTKLRQIAWSRFESDEIVGAGSRIRNVVKDDGL